MDLVVRAQRLPQPGETLAGQTFAQVAGGKGGNQAVAAARLGAQVTLVGCLGADANGAQLRAGLEAEQIDCTALETHAAVASGVALIVVDDASQNAIVIVAGANGLLNADALARHDAALAAKVVVCQLETPLDAVHEALARARRHGATTILNPAPANGPLPDGWLMLIDYLIPNEHEAAALTGLPVDSPDTAAAAAAQLRAGGARNVIVTLGAQGVLALLEGTPAVHHPAPKVHAVDTTAAGDTLIGALAAQLAQGVAAQEAIAFAQHAAALSVTRAGAQPSIPFLAELQR
ncbi:ribokinase [Paraburkholderia bonniea]|nr:ribokinase [Paraburkholderia bonniea]WJF91410.1 ribokinase [Paraburkholderia bonniea]WJF94727.1 ribokinase [Paraburkholderia bonniea]